MKLSIKSKIIGTSTLAVVLCLVISLFAGSKTNTNLNIYKYIAEVNFPNMQAQADMEKASVLIEAVANLLIGSNTTDKDVKEAEVKLNMAIKLFESSSKKYEDLPFVEGEEAIWKKFKAEFWTEYVAHAKKIINLSGTGKSEDRNGRDSFAADIWKKDIERRDHEFNQLNNFQNTEVKRNSQIASSQINLLSWLIPVLFLAAGLLGTGAAIIIGTVISKNLMDITDKVSSSSQQVRSASTQIASVSEELSQATTEQAASLQEASSSIEEISSMINANTENAKKSSHASEQSLITAERGKEVVVQMKNAIGDIHKSNQGIMNQIDETNKEIENIVKIINDIGAKTKVINDIVFQTKLLSFNASVEAARAGENGKGFAVVAQEVGNLASMSGAAALEITNMLDGSIKSVERIVKNSKEKISILVSDGKNKVETGTRIANECQEVLTEIVTSVASVSKMVTEISTASQEQAKGVHEITKAVAQLDQVTQQNTVNSAESSSAANALANQAEELNQFVSQLELTIKGSASNQDHSIFREASVKPKTLIKAPMPKTVVQKKIIDTNKDYSGLPLNDDRRFEEA
jgi:methyl-accepting chemotaxis protein